jgi:hypothetical protein
LHDVAVEKKNAYTPPTGCKHLIFAVWKTPSSTEAPVQKVWHFFASELNFIRRSGSFRQG